MSTIEDDLTQRLLPLEGGVNFRDMGGYPAHEGRRVKWRHLYRSGTMSRLTSADREHLAQRGIRTVIDFRTVEEQEREPNEWGLSLGDAYWRRPHTETFGNWSGLDPAKLQAVRDVEIVMEEGYRHLPRQQAEAYAEMFRRLAAGNVPAVIHCTAGKDRTGGGAALILAALGVPRDAIIADFVMTERAVDLTKALAGRKRSAKYDAFAKIDPTVVKAFASARPGFIGAFLDSLDSEFGSVEGYLAHLDMTAPDIAAMRASLLE